jgi:N-acetylglucosamine kinase-like BadF-type ATPase
VKRAPVGDGSTVAPVILGVDAGNSKTELLVATLDGEPSALVRGPGTNAHGAGADGCISDIARLVERAALQPPAEHGAFFLCGVDIPSDIVEVTEAVNRTGWVRAATVDNDTFALLRAGSDAADVVAVVCGAGINCAGRSADGRVARYPSLGWETGDWGGSVMLGRDVLFHAARGEDARGRPTALTEIVRAHFGMSIAEVGEAIHYGRIGAGRLGELAPEVVRAAEDGDAVAGELIGRLAGEIVLMVVRALADLGVEAADVVLGGGMLRAGSGPLFDEVIVRLAAVAPAARPVAATDPPVLGAALVALEAAGAPTDAGVRLRAAMRAGVASEDLPSGTA